jgi:hypothetical protein
LGLDVGAVRPCGHLLRRRIRRVSGTASGERRAQSVAVTDVAVHTISGISQSMSMLLRRHLLRMG